MRPILLDLFCGAGGAAEGYRRAGFFTIGVDKHRQPRYSGDEFRQADAIEVLERLIAGQMVATEEPGRSMTRWDLAAIHASPPCQRHSAMTVVAGRAEDHPELVAPTRELLIELGLPYVIENVPRAPLRDPITLCGSMFGLAIPEGVIRRHRLFECSFPVTPPPSCRHPRNGPQTLGIYGGGTRQVPRPTKSGGDTPKATAAQARRLMQTPWMTLADMNQAIPPSYTEFLGGSLMQAVTADG